MDAAILESIYHYVKTYIAAHNLPPSQREIAAGCHVSLPTVTRYLDILEAQKRIKRVPGQARGIMLCEGDED